MVVRLIPTAREIWLSFQPSAISRRTLSTSYRECKAVSRSVQRYREVLTTQHTTHAAAAS
jgi:hypothetical protein